MLGQVLWIAIIQKGVVGCQHDRRPLCKVVRVVAQEQETAQHSGTATDHQMPPKGCARVSPELREVKGGDRQEGHDKGHPHKAATDPEQSIEPGMAIFKRRGRRQ